MIRNGRGKNKNEIQIARFGWMKRSDFGHNIHFGSFTLAV